MMPIQGAAEKAFIMHDQGETAGKSPLMPLLSKQRRVPNGLNLPMIS
jgi:hypothetical protein